MGGSASTSGALAPLAGDLYRSLRERGVAPGRIRDVVLEQAGRALAAPPG